jgi:hypothetical protein
MNNPYSIHVLFDRFLGIALFGIGFLFLSWIITAQNNYLIFGVLLFFFSRIVLEISADRTSRDRDAYDRGSISPRGNF